MAWWWVWREIPGLTPALNNQEALLGGRPFFFSLFLFTGSHNHSLSEFIPRFGDPGLSPTAALYFLRETVKLAGSPSLTRSCKRA